MTEASARLTWQEVSRWQFNGYAGDIALFVIIWARPAWKKDGRGWLLSTTLPGLEFRMARDEDAEPLKDVAEGWLAEFAATIGATFPGAEPDRWKALLGKRVRVMLTEEPHKTVTTGTLLGFGDDGEFEVQDAVGVIHYCWPALHMEERDAEQEKGYDATGHGR